MENLMYHVYGDIRGQFTKDELLKLCKEKDLVVSVLVAGFLSESLEYFEIDYYLEKRYRNGYMICLVNRKDKQFYCRGYNS